jgi:hypothetical protein
MPALAFLVLLVAQGPPAGSDAAAAIARGDTAHAAFDLEGARGEYAGALAIEPASVEAGARLAHVTNDLGEDARAHATDTRRRGDEAGTERAEAEARALFEQALALAEGLQRDAPGRPEGHYALAATLGNLTPFLSGPEKVRAARQIDEAARRATELDPCLAPAYAVLAITYRELSSLGGSCAAWRGRRSAACRRDGPPRRRPSSSGPSLSPTGNPGTGATVRTPLSECAGSRSSGSPPEIRLGRRGGRLAAEVTSVRFPLPGPSDARFGVDRLR